jgi:hypothetical protein
MTTELKKLQILVVTIFVVVFVISIIGVVTGDLPANAVPEVAELSTGTSMETQGIVITSTTLSMQLGTDTLNEPPLENGGYLWTWDPVGPSGPFIDGYTVDPWVASIYGTPVPLGQVQYTSGYNEGVTATAGHLLYQKVMGIRTANKTIGQDNIGADRLVTFVGGEGGRMTSSEDILVDGTGAQVISANRDFCPFTSADNPFSPQFCNVVVSGSSADISTGSISTSAGVRFITASTDVPVAETYIIHVKAVTGSDGSSSANGTASAFIKARLQEGREQQVPRRFDSDPIGFYPVKAEDLSFSEILTASGSISSFTKEMQYKSGIRLA